PDINIITSKQSKAKQTLKHNELTIPQPLQASPPHSSRCTNKPSKATHNPSRCTPTTSSSNKSLSPSQSTSQSCTSSTQTALCSRSSPRKLPPLDLPPLFPPTLSSTATTFTTWLPPRQSTQPTQHSSMSGRNMLHPLPLAAS